MANIHLKTRIWDLFFRASARPRMPTTLAINRKFCRRPLSLYAIDFVHRAERTLRGLGLLIIVTTDTFFLPTSTCINFLSISDNFSIYIYKSAFPPPSPPSFSVLVDHFVKSEPPFPQPRRKHHLQKYITTSI